MTHMIDRTLFQRLKTSAASALLLGPRQVGKSTLMRALKPLYSINLMEENLFLRYTKEPQILIREVRALKKTGLIVIDEVQRVPKLLNQIQVLIDEKKGFRFLLSGSSARKLKWGHANLLPGRIIVEHLNPLSFWELGAGFSLEKALKIGTLPGIYLNANDAGPLLESYGQTYLREEIQAEALTQNLGAYARFLDVAAEMSGQWINYSKLSSDAEIPKETLRRFYGLLEDTLIVRRIPPFRPQKNHRRVQQREKFIFFDLGVRNALLGLHQSKASPAERGVLFEQWMGLQILQFASDDRRLWKISSFRTDTSAEVDWIIETPRHLYAVECKSGKNVSIGDFKAMEIFEGFASKPVQKIVVFCGETAQRFSVNAAAYPFKIFLSDVLPAWQ